MMGFLQFVFQSFWHFIGFTIILGIVVEGIVRLVRGPGPNYHYHNNGCSNECSCDEEKK